MSQDEQVDIVNEHDEIVGNSSKFEAHEKGLLHRTVISEVIRSDGSWLMVKQASDRQDAGQFVSPVGGHVQSGESIADALAREASEELGLNGNISFEFVKKFVYNREVIGRKENHMFIVHKIFSDATPVLNHESVAYEYFTEQQLRMNIRERPEMFGAAFLAVAEKCFPQLYTEPGN